MLAEERRQQVQKIVEERGRVTIEEIVEKFNVSAVTALLISETSMRNANWHALEDSERLLKNSHQRRYAASLRLRRLKGTYAHCN